MRRRTALRPLGRPAFLVALLLALLASPATAADITDTGQARARGPATLAIGGARFTLEGVEARADAEPTLARLLESGPVTCTRDHRLGHGHYAARCTLEDGRDLAEALVAAGVAVPRE